MISLIILLLIPIGAPAQQAEQQIVRVPEDMETINAAIDDAPVGANVETFIEVRPGTYLEDLTIDGREHVAVRPAASGTVVVMGSVSISNSIAIELQGLTIQGGSHGIDVQDSTVSFRNLEIRSSRGVGLNLVDVLTTVEGVSIAGHADAGLTISDSKARLIGNVIEDNAGVGLSLSQQSSVSVTANRIRDNAGDGIQLAASSAELIDNVVLENGGYGVSLDNASSLSGQGNRLARNEMGNLSPASLPFSATTNIRRVPEDVPTIAAGIEAIATDPILHLSPGIYRLNLDYQSESLELRGDGSDVVTLVAEETHDPIIRISDTSKVVLAGLTVRGALGDSAVEIAGSAEAKLTKVRISGHRNRGAGAALVIREDARAELSDVQVIGNRSTGLLLQDNAQAKLQSTRMDRNGVHGLELRNAAIAELADCTLNANAGQGLRLEDSTQAFVTSETEIIGNGDAGVDVRSLAGVAISNSSIDGNGKHGLWVQGFAELNQSTLQGNRKCGVKAESGAQIVGAGNAITGNEPDVCPEDFLWPPDFREEP